MKIDKELDVSKIKDFLVPENVKDIWIHYSEGLFTGFSWNATIEYRNGSTTVEKRFKSKDYQSLMIQVKDFLEQNGK